MPPTGSFFPSSSTALREPDLDIRASRLKLAELTKDMLTHTLGLLGISCPAKMLRKD